MLQDLKIEEERLHAFFDTVRATLPAKCVRTHAMIHDDQLTYVEVEKKLRVTERCVHEYMKTVHRAFRTAPPSVGIAAPKSPHRGRTKATADVTSQPSTVPMRPLTYRHRPAANAMRPPQ